MRYSWRIYAVCIAVAFLHNSIFATTKQPKSLFFRVNLEQNRLDFGHFETQDHKIKAVESKQMVTYDENDVMQLIRNELTRRLKSKDFGFYSWHVGQSKIDFKRQYS